MRLHGDDPLDLRPRPRAPRETIWRVRSIGRPHDQLNVILTADTTSETVCRAIEQAAANNGIVIERVEAQP